MDGYKGGQRRRQVNQDLWERFWAAVSCLGVGCLSIVKVKAHAGEAEVAAGLITAEGLAGNYIADALAGLAAEKHQVDPGVAESCGWSDGVARQIQKRLVAIGLFCAGHPSWTDLQAERELEDRLHAGVGKRKRGEALRAKGPRHHLVRAGRWWQCMHCLQRSSRQGKGKLLSTPCPRGAAPAKAAEDQEGARQEEDLLLEEALAAAGAAAEEEEDPFGFGPMGLDNDEGVQAAAAPRPERPTVEQRLPSLSAEPAAALVERWGLDKSHDMVLHHGAVVCRICGAYAVSAPRSLKGPCPRRPSVRGRAALGKLERGVPLA